MPRGKNYVNNHRGVHLKVGGNGAQKMIQCEYGSACRRPDCIYRHDDPQPGDRNDLCIPFLAGKCSFEKGCRKRHPSKDEIPRLLAKYKKTRCRFRDECYTEGCLFLHPNEEKQKEPNFIAPHHFPPLSSTCTKISSVSPESDFKQATAWKKNPPTVIATDSTDIESSNGPLQMNASAFPRASEQQHPDQPPTTWSHSNGSNGEPTTMMNIPPPQQQPMPPTLEGFYGGSMSIPSNLSTMVPNMVTPVFDPNTGYPIDPSTYYHDQQIFYYHQHQLQGMTPPVPNDVGTCVPSPPMVVPFNAEAKEFVPGMFAA